MTSFRFGKVIKELRIHLCQTNSQSAGVRDFVQKHYVNLKRENPTFPILIRECSGVQPRIWVRYEKGVEHTKSLTDMGADDVLNSIKQMNK